MGERESIVNQRQAAEAILARAPSGPDFIQPTLEYCQDGITAAISVAQNSLTTIIENKRQKVEALPPHTVGQQPAKDVALLQLDQDLNLIQNIDDAKGAAFAPTFQDLKIFDPNPQDQSPQPSILIRPEDREIKLPLGQRQASEFFFRALLHVDNHLGLPYRYIAMFLPNQRDRVLTYPSTGRYYRYVDMLRRIQTMGNFSLEDPIIGFLTVAYTTQAAKHEAVDKTRILIKKVLELNPHQEGQSIIIPSYIKTVIQDRIAQIRRDESYIAAGGHSLNRLQTQFGFSDEQRQLLLDVAFASTEGLTGREQDIQTAFGPIINFIQQGNWQEAIKHRDFLLRYCGKTFPDWRQREIAKEQTGQTLTQSISDLLPQLESALGYGTPLLTPQDIPDSYKHFFRDYLQKYAENLHQRKAQEILQSSTQLSTAILHKIHALRPKDLLLGNALTYEIQYNPQRERQETRKPFDTDEDDKYIFDFGFILRNQVRGASTDASMMAQLQQIIREEFARFPQAATNFTIEEYLDSLMGSKFMKTSAVQKLLAGL